MNGVRYVEPEAHRKDVLEEAARKCEDMAQNIVDIAGKLSPEMRESAIIRGETLVDAATIIRGLK